jgi:hypothetical protein
MKGWMKGAVKGVVKGNVLEVAAENQNHSVERLTGKRLMVQPSVVRGRARSKLDQLASVWIRTNHRPRQMNHCLGIAYYRSRRRTRLTAAKISCGRGTALTNGTSLTAVAPVVCAAATAIVLPALS